MFWLVEHVRHHCQHRVPGLLLELLQGHPARVGDLVVALGDVQRPRPGPLRHQPADEVQVRVPELNLMREKKKGTGGKVHTADEDNCACTRGSEYWRGSPELNEIQHQVGVVRWVGDSLNLDEVLVESFRAQGGIVRAVLLLLSTKSRGWCIGGGKPKKCA